MTRILAVALLLGAGSVAAQTSADKTGKGFGELLKGMGQELGKAGGSATAPKKDAKKADAPKAKKDPAAKPKESSSSGS